MTPIVRWRIFENHDGRRFIMGVTTDGSCLGPIALHSFNPKTMCVGDYEIVGPPCYDDWVQHHLETGWQVERDARDVTSKACRELGVEESVFAGYTDGDIPRNRGDSSQVLLSLFKEPIVPIRVRDKCVENTVSLAQELLDAGVRAKLESLGFAVPVMLANVAIALSSAIFQHLGGNRDWTPDDDVEVLVRTVAHVLAAGTDDEAAVAKLIRGLEERPYRGDTQRTLAYCWRAAWWLQSHAVNTELVQQRLRDVEPEGTGK